MLQAILTAISDFRDDTNKRFNAIESKIDNNGKRIGLIGEQISYLEDDAPTNEEFEKLHKRVSKLEKRHYSN